MASEVNTTSKAVDQSAARNLPAINSQEPDGIVRSNVKNLSISEAGIRLMTGAEEPVTGIYTDPVAGMCTYGVGQVVHEKDKYNGNKIPCLLLNAASASEDDKITSHIKETKSKSPYLDQSILSLKDKEFAKLTDKSEEAGAETLAKIMHKKSLSDLDEATQAEIRAKAKSAIASEKKLLEKNIYAAFREKIKQYELDVKHSIKVPLSQAEYDSLVDLKYNVSTRGFKHVAKAINSGNFRHSDPSIRKTAQLEIEQSFMQTAKVDGQEVLGLMSRREIGAKLFNSQRYPDKGEHDRIVSRIRTERKAAAVQVAALTKKYASTLRGENTGSIMKINGNYTETCSPWSIMDKKEDAQPFKLLKEANLRPDLPKKGT